MDKMKKLIEEAWISIRILLPDYWLMNYGYRKQVDEFILNHLDSVRLNCGFTADIGGKSFWVANYPYAFGTPHGLFSIEKCRPSRKTIFKLWIKVKGIREQIESRDLKNFLYPEKKGPRVVKNEAGR